MNPKENADEVETPEAPQHETVRDALSAAFAQEEARTGVAETEIEPEETLGEESRQLEAPTTEEGKSKARDGKGKFTKAAAEKAGEREAKPEEKGAREEAKPDARVEASAALKAPQSWTPGEREEFAKATPGMQKASLRREGEIQKALNESAFSRRSFETVQNIVNPHLAMLRAQNISPYQAIDSMFRTAEMLHSGPQHQKAHEIAKLVHTYLPGKDGFESFDRALAALYGGKQPEGQTQQTQQFHDPRLDALLAKIDAGQASASQRETAQLTASYGEFAKTHEYFEDVREDMSAVILSRAAKGIELTDEQAYNLALKLHPEIDSIVQQKAAAAKARKVDPSIARARAASSSIRGVPVGGLKGKPQPDDLRGTLEAAFDAAGVD